MSKPRRPGLSSLSSLVSGLTQHASSKRGFYQQQILQRWPLIVGQDMAGYCVPQKISRDPHGQYGATLHLQCEPAWAIHISYMEPVILEKIATYLGYRAVSRLVIHQGPVHNKAANKVPQRPTTSPSGPIAPAIEAQLENMTDSELAAQLRSLAPPACATDSLESGA